MRVSRSDARLSGNLAHLREELDLSRHNLEAVRRKRAARETKNAERDRVRLEELLGTGMSMEDAQFELKKTKRDEKLR